MNIEVGATFGDWTVLNFVRLSKHNANLWLCKCNCGNERQVIASNLRTGKSLCCGCRKLKTKHGMCGTPTYTSWEAMRARCNNPKNVDYHSYGGRGIKVCERWASFVNFLADMDERPEGMTLDRIDNDGNYEPGNCRWTTKEVQRDNSTLSIDYKTGRFKRTIRGNKPCK